MKTPIVVTMLLLAGCATTPAPVPDETTVEKKDTPPPAEAAPAEKKSGCSLDSECSDGQLCLKNKCTEITKGLAECRDFKIDFAFNSVVFEPNVKPHLFRMARCLRADQSLKVQIAGNADERGTEEYNMVLSQKRAASVRKYLVDLGVAGGALDTVGYGENKPAVSGANEDAWAANRRVEFKKK